MQIPVFSSVLSGLRQHASRLASRPVEIRGNPGPADGAVFAGGRMQAQSNVPDIGAQDELLLDLGFEALPNNELASGLVDGSDEFRIAEWIGAASGPGSPVRFTLAFRERFQTEIERDIPPALMVRAEVAKVDDQKRGGNGMLQPELDDRQIIERGGPYARSYLADVCTLLSWELRPQDRRAILASDHTRPNRFYIKKEGEWVLVKVSYRLPHAAGESPYFEVTACAPETQRQRFTNIFLRIDDWKQWNIPGASRS